MQTIDVTDEDAANAPKEGLLALQIHQGPPMKVQFKNFKLVELEVSRAFFTAVMTRSSFFPHLCLLTCGFASKASADTEYLVVSGGPALRRFERSAQARGAA
jgi:hypothetical protein